MSMSIYDRYRLLFRVLKDFYMLNKCNNNQAVLHLLARILESDIEFLRLNKLLVGLAELCYSLSYRSDVLDQRLRRYRIYYEEARRISHAMEFDGIRFAFFKTITVFPKDIADLDILTFSTEDLESAEKVLAEIGYKRRKKGLEQHLWSLARDGVVVDVELHTSVAAAGYEYYPKSIIFRNVVKVDGIMTTSPLDSVMLTVAHSVLKDLYITLADILDFTLTINKHNIDYDALIQRSRNLGLLTPLVLYLFLLSRFDEKMHERLGLVNYSFWRKLFTAIDYRKITLRPGINTLIPSYLELTINKLRYKQLSTVLSEVLSLPQGKGIDNLIYYMVGAKPLVKKFSE